MPLPRLNINQWQRRARACLPVALVLSSCAGGMSNGAPPPLALLDAYLIAHGMATSYAESERAEPVVVDQLVKLDRRAAAAVRSMAQMPNSDPSATAAAISALTAFAARHSAIAQ